MTFKLPESNLLINSYFQELLVLSSEIIRNFNEIEVLVNSKKHGEEGVLSFPGSKDYFFVQPEVFTRISSLQVHSSNINKILIDSGRRKNEKEYRYNLRSDRVKELQKHFDVNQIQEIRKSEVRNSLEHYDEYLDKVAFDLWNGTMIGKYHVVVANVIASREGTLPGIPYYLKSYFIDSKIYKNAGKESNIGAIVSEAMHIQQVAENILQSDQLSGSIIPIPPED